MMGSAPAVVLRTPKPEDFKRSLSNETVSRQRLTSVGERSVREMGVRRALKGLVLSDEVPASLRLRNADGTPSDLINSSVAPETGASSSKSPGRNFNFLLQSIAYQRSEKFQEVETFGATYGFFYGEKPIVLTAQAVLYDAPNFEWLVEWLANYEDSLRGTQLVSKNNRAYLSYAQFVVEGYLLSCNIEKSAAVPDAANLTFTMWATNIVSTVQAGLIGEARGSGAESGFTGYSEFAVNGNPLPLGELTSNKVAEANARFLTDTGVSKLVRAGQAISQAIQFISDPIPRSVRNLMLGTPYVLPAGFVSQTQEDVDTTTISDTVLNLIRPPDGSLTSPLRPEIRFREKFLVDPNVSSSSVPFYDRADEYPFRRPSGVDPSKLDQKTVEGEFKSSEEIAGKIANRLAKEYSLKGDDLNGWSVPRGVLAAARLTYGAVALAGQYAVRPATRSLIDEAQRVQLSRNVSGPSALRP
jgi:hypothetical protein